MVYTCWICGKEIKTEAEQVKIGSFYKYIDSFYKYAHRKCKEKLEAR